MKKYIYIYIISMGFILFGCEDMEFTTPEPKDRITIDIALRFISRNES